MISTPLGVPKSEQMGYAYINGKGNGPGHLVPRRNPMKYTVIFPDGYEANHTSINPIYAVTVVRTTGLSKLIHNARRISELEGDLTSGYCGDEFYSYECSPSDAQRMIANLRAEMDAVFDSGKPLTEPRGVWGISRHHETREAAERAYDREIAAGRQCQIVPVYPA